MLNSTREYVVFGGGGFVGSHVAAVLRARGASVAVVDRNPPPGELLRAGVAWIRRDVLTESGPLPRGHVILSLGTGNPRARWGWTLPLDTAVATARVLRSLDDRDVTLVSSVEVYGEARGPLSETTEPRLPWHADELGDWSRRFLTLADGPCPPWRVAADCRRFAQADPSGRWVYGAAKLVQEQLVAAIVPPERLTVLRLANTFGIGQDRVVVRLLRRAMAGSELRVTDTVRSFVAVEDVGRAALADSGPGVFNLGGEPVALLELASSICRETGSRSAIRRVPAPASDSTGVVDARRIRTAGVELEDVFAHCPGSRGG